jgi:hypothetical protein
MTKACQKKEKRNNINSYHEKYIFSRMHIASLDMLLDSVGKKKLPIRFNKMSSVQQDHGGQDSLA